jgi:hypothetical protein
LVFERLFGTGERGERQRSFELRQKSQRSVLDFVLDDATRVRRQLGQHDRRKLDEYLAGVRSSEERIKSSEQFGQIPDPDVDTPAGIPDNFGLHMEIMYDLLALAFQTDSTSIASLLLAYDGSNRIFPDLGITEGHHYLTHNQRQEDLAEKVAAIDHYYMERFAVFLDKLAHMEDVDGNSVLFNSMIVYGGAIADGNRHTHDNLPVILAGSAGGQFNTCRYFQVEDKPMSNLFVSLLGQFGVETDAFGDSDGQLDSELRKS